MNKPAVARLLGCEGLVGVGGRAVATLRDRQASGVFGVPLRRHPLHQIAG